MATTSRTITTTMATTGETFLFIATSLLCTLAEVFPPEWGYGVQVKEGKRFTMTP
jgi:hypothetical protein